MPDWIAGVDEAGRGPLAGPVVIAAVVLDPARRVNGLRDSKELLPERREVLAERIRARALAWSVIAMQVADIDRLNILYATLEGMQRAVAALKQLPVHVQVDGDRAPSFPCSAEAIIGGDAQVRAISAASILAKVTRDAYMCELEHRFPGYGFVRNKGYSTPEHFAGLHRLGPCVQHRRSFAPVKMLLAGRKLNREHLEVEHEM